MGCVIETLTHSLTLHSLTQDERWWGILAEELQFNHGSSLSSSFACRDAEESVNESPFHRSSSEEAPQSNRLHGLLIKASAARETLRPHLRLSLRTRWHGHSLRDSVFDCRASSPCSRLASAVHAYCAFIIIFFKSF